MLNRPEAVTPATRQRVLAAIEEFSFVRNGAARQLRAGTITAVDAILLDIRKPTSRMSYGAWRTGSRSIITR